MNFLKILRKVGMRLRLGREPSVVQVLLRRIFRVAKGRQEVKDFDGGLIIELDLSEHMQRRIFWMGYYNLRLVALLNRVLAPGMVVVDVGANIGEVSLVCANRVGPEGRVIAFEPVDAIAEELRRNIRRNRLESVVQIRKQGLADLAGQFTMYESYGQSAASDCNRGLGSLHGDPRKDRVLGAVEVVTLDAVVEHLKLQRLDLLKVDIEGGELSCLRGGLRTLRRFRPVIVVEVQEQAAMAAGYRGRDILDLLTPLGYCFHRLEEEGKIVRISAESLGDYQDVVCIAGAEDASVLARQ